MKITLIGNCQTKALSWYIQQLDQSFCVKWIRIAKFSKALWAQEQPPYGSRFYGKSINIIADIRKSKERLLESDYVIYQNLKILTSLNYHSKVIKKYSPNAKFISISSFYYKHGSILGMKKRAKELKIDIPAHKMIKKHGSKIKAMGRHLHPNAFYFLELVREICEITNWPYYDDKVYNQYLKEGFPFG